MHTTLAFMLLHAGHGMPTGHVHPWDVVALGAVALTIVGLQWWAERRGR